MLGGEKRHHPVARGIVTKVRDQMPQVVFLGSSDGTISQEDVRALPGQAAHGVVSVDPGVDAGGHVEFGSWRTQLDRGDGWSCIERYLEIHKDGY